jgi:hypothetical protein
MVAATDTSILQRIIGLDRTDMPAEAAMFMLTLGFTDRDKERMSELSGKASEGSLSEAEAREIDSYILASDLIAMFQSKARMALRATPAAR